MERKDDPKARYIILYPRDNHSPPIWPTDLRLLLKIAAELILDYLIDILLRRVDVYNFVQIDPVQGGVVGLGGVLVDDGDGEHRVLGDEGAEATIYQRLQLEGQVVDSVRGVWVWSSVDVEG